MNVIKYILETKHSARHLKSSFGIIRLRSLSLFLMVVKELRYLLLDNEVCARDYSDGVLCKPRGIWWLGRNRFTRFVAFVA